jgi:hypothetical protein
VQRQLTSYRPWLCGLMLHKMEHRWGVESRRVDISAAYKAIRCTCWARKYVGRQTVPPSATRRIWRWASMAIPSRLELPWSEILDTCLCSSVVSFDAFLYIFISWGSQPSSAKSPSPPISCVCYLNQRTDLYYRIP